VSAPLRSSAGLRYDVEFSLALNNRTGKYFVCRDMIADLGDQIAGVRYWRARRRRTPTGLEARILGRLMTEEFVARTRWPTFDRFAPRIGRRRPVIFTDPLQVLFYHLDVADIVLCHDLGPLTHPHFYAPGVEAAYAKAFSQIVRARPHMIFVSRSSRTAFEARFGAAYARADVVYPALRAEAETGGRQSVAGIDGPFLLSVGAVGARKNHVGAIRAFARSGLAAEGFRYVVSGGSEPGYDAVAALARTTPGVMLLGYAPDDELRWLYANAAGFVLPSHLEGFGFPAAEAVRNGLVPLVSRGGALEEVTGDGALLVDPEDEADIAAGLLRLVSLADAERSARLAALQENLARFSAQRAREAWRRAVLGYGVPADHGPDPRQSVALQALS
jgi:glycosyltransferase involved in cell wall biosynthesis